jgi:endoglucanase
MILESVCVRERSRREFKMAEVVRKLVSVLLVLGVESSCAAQEFPPLWRSYTSAFMDDQVRVIDHDASDRTTSEAQAYAMFFALVANDRARFDSLLRWTELNLASGDLTAHLPAWLWGRRANKEWGVIDANSASDADVWMAYTLLEAGRAWGQSRYTELGTALADRIAAEEIVEVPEIGTVLLPGANGFHRGESYRLNASYLPLQLFLRLGHLRPDGPWQKVAAGIPLVVTSSAPHGFATDWIEYTPAQGFKPSAVGSYDAIRVYLWAGLLDPGTPNRDALLKALQGMLSSLRTNPTPPAKVTEDGRVDDPRGPVGFSAALRPYLIAIGEKNLDRELGARVRSQLNGKTGLYGNPARYYDQNLALFALGATERQFWFDADGTLRLAWKRE